MNRDTKRISAYIARHWVDTYPKAAQRATMLESPYVYTTSAQSGYLNRSFYWDTYFTNIGLLQQGRADLALGSIEHFKKMFEDHGLMPNWNQEEGTNRSQVPYFAHMIRDYFMATHNVEWLKYILPTVEAEYDFWMTKRPRHEGLNGLGHDADEAYLKGFYHQELVPRLGYDPKASDAEQVETAAHYLIEAESCADFTSRFEARAGHCLALDLNANLFCYERFMAWASCQIGHPENAAEWMARSEERAQKISQIHWDEKQGWFFDYNFVEKRLTPQRCAIAFSMLWNGVATDSQAERMHEQIDCVECPHGLVATEEAHKLAVAFQWDHPFGWPPHQYIAVHGLLRYGYEEAALRIADKYLKQMILHFNDSGQLWEKHNVVDGSIDSAEYEVQEQMGWTAAVFLDFAKLLGYELIDPYPY